MHDSTTAGGSGTTRGGCAGRSKWNAARSRSPHELREGPPAPRAAFHFERLCNVVLGRALTLALSLEESLWLENLAILHATHARLSSREREGRIPSLRESAL